MMMTASKYGLNKKILTISDGNVADQLPYSVTIVTDNVLSDVMLMKLPLPD